MHAAALAWVPPGFAAFDTGRPDVGAGNVVTEKPPGPQPAADPEPAAPRPRNRAALDAGTDPAEAAPVRQRPCRRRPIPTRPSRGGPDGIERNRPPVPVNGHDANPDPMEIPEFLRRVQ